MNASESFDRNVAPVWWDPKIRRIMIDKKANVAAVMFFNHESISIVSPESVIVEAQTSDLWVTWKGSLRCDLSIIEDGGISTSGTYRIYFAPPVRNAPRLDQASIDEIGVAIQQSSKTAKRVGQILGTSAVMGDYLAIGRLVSESIAYYRLISDLRAGKVNADAFREALQAAH